MFKTKRLKKFKFRKNLQIEVLKMMMFLKTKYSEKIQFSDIETDELLDIQHNPLSSRVERQTYKVSGRPIYSVLQHQLVLSKTAPCQESSYFPLPEEVQNAMKGLINFQNKDNRCFRWILKSWKQKLSKKLEMSIRNLQNNSNLKGLKIAVHEKNCAKIEKRNKT